MNWDLMWLLSVLIIMALAAWFVIRGIFVTNFGEYKGTEAMIFRFLVSMAGMAGYVGFCERMLGIKFAAIVVRTFGG